MPSNITPKDFEPLLPEERDTIAQGLLKYIKFAILFWRWYRDAHEKLDAGDMSSEFLRGVCETGCLGGELVVEGVANENPTQEELEEDVFTPLPSTEPTTPTTPTPGGKLPVDTNKWTPAPDLHKLPPIDRFDFPAPYAPACCEFSKDHKFFFWGEVGGANLMCLNGVKVAAIRNGVPGGVSFKTKGNANFMNFASWKYWTNATGRKDTLVKPVPGFGGGLVNDAERALSIFDKVEVFIYGVAPALQNQDGKTPPIKGAVFYNGGTSFVPFRVKNGGVFGAQVILKNVVPEGTDQLGRLLRDIEIHFSNLHTEKISDNAGDNNQHAGRVVRNTWFDKDKWPLQVSSNGVLKRQPYLAYVAGIRLVILHQDQSVGTFEYPVRLGQDALNSQVILDDRWQNDNPCYEPTDIKRHWGWHRPEAYAPLWTTDKHEGGLYKIYSPNYVGGWPQTSHIDDNSKWRGPKE